MAPPDDSADKRPKPTKEAGSPVMSAARPTNTPSSTNTALPATPPPSSAPLPPNFDNFRRVPQVDPDWKGPSYMTPSFSHMFKTGRIGLWMGVSCVVFLGMGYAISKDTDKYLTNRKLAFNDPSSYTNTNKTGKMAPNRSLVGRVHGDKFDGERKPVPTELSALLSKPEPPPPFM